MTKLKRKTTPFARLFLALIIIVPLAYFGASYINQEDPIQNIKELVNMEEGTKKSTQTVKVDSKSVDELKEENNKLKQTLRKRDKEIQDLRQELQNCK
jgi:cell division protein FtsB